MDPKIYVYDMTPADWQSWCRGHDFKPFVASQVQEWLYAHQRDDPATFSNLAAPVRQALANDFRWGLPAIDTALGSVDGSDKYLLRLDDKRLIEMVLMPSENRVTLCISSQVGCQMGCRFCQTGRMGLMRNLSRGEILAQVLLANAQLRARGDARRVTNIVFMGMGEPLDNYDNVVGACRALTDPRLFGLSKHRVTVSTCGLVPRIRELGRDVAVSLAISLHASTDEERSAMMPVNERHPLAELKQALLEYPIAVRHGITFEYVMIRGKNDSIAHAKKLVRFLHGLKAKVNLIPLNHHPGIDMAASDAEALRAFQKYLADRSIPAPVRYSRGQDVSGACGQLVMKRQEDLSLPPLKVAAARRRELREGARV